MPPPPHRIKTRTLTALEQDELMEFLRQLHGTKWSEDDQEEAKFGLRVNRTCIVILPASQTSNAVYVKTRWG